VTSHASNPAPIAGTGRRRRYARWLLAAAATFLTLLLVEIGLRLAGLRYGDMYVPDPYCGSRLRAGYQGWFTREGSAYIRINSQGLRDEEHSIRRGDDLLRIAVLGDSFAEALQVPREQTFWHVLEQRLNDSGLLASRQAEVINFGVSGYGTAQEFQMLRHYVWAYDPQIVVLAFYPGNDVQNNSKELEPDGARPFFHLRDGKLVRDDSFREHPVYVASQEYCCNSSGKHIGACAAEHRRAATAVRISRPATLFGSRPMNAGKRPGTLRINCCWKWRTNAARMGRSYWWRWSVRTPWCIQTRPCAGRFWRRPEPPTAVTRSSALRPSPAAAASPSWI
jgi:hypothetical protein